MLLLAVSACSVSAYLTRLAELEGSPGVVTAMWRSLIAAVVVLPLALARGRGKIKALTKRERFLLAVSGVALGLHLAAWTASLDYTSIASAVLFVTLTPIFVSLGSQFILRERLSWPVWLAIFITVGGGIIIIAVDLGASGQLFGDLLALLAALLVTVYLLIGRTLRPKLHLLPYIGTTYTIAAITIFLTALAMGHNLVAYTPRAWLMFVLLALFPSLVGHSSYNWALRHFPSFVISVVNLGEPVIAIILAALFLDEAPTATKTVGGLILLLGIFLTIHFTRRREATAPLDP